MFLFRFIFSRAFILPALFGSLAIGFYANATLVITITPILLDKIEIKYGEPAKKRVSNWDVLMKQGASSDQSDLAKMEEANHFFNQVKWVSDIEHWGVEDYWATPIETLATNGGDCEDYSIGKYFTLLKTRIPNEKLRITYVKSLTFDQAHMVLAYYPTPSSEPLILDNINGKILPASQRKDLVPIYSFNGQSIWLARNRSERLKTNSEKSLPQWKKLNARFLKELGQL